MSVINNVAGGGMSSRLFQKIREELGLCYTVYTYPSCYLKTGTFAVYAGVNPKSAEKAYRAILDVLNELKKNGITEDEFARGTAYAIMKLSELAGVSPLAAWNDLQPAQRKSLYTPVNQQWIEVPRIEFRGLALNNSPPMKPQNYSQITTIIMQKKTKTL